MSERISRLTTGLTSAVRDTAMEARNGVMNAWTDLKNLSPGSAALTLGQTAVNIPFNLTRRLKDALWSVVK